MKPSIARRRLCQSVAGIVLLLIVAPSVMTDEPAKPKREQIGEVRGKPVYRDEIRGGFSTADELHRLFTAPVMERYRKAHKDEIAPTEEELDEVMAKFEHMHRERMKTEEPRIRAELKEVEQKLSQLTLDKKQRQTLESQKQFLELQLKPPGRDFAVFVFGNWKFQRHLYDHFGGGRYLWQQAGMEAFDAMHNWLLTHEANGDFKISDPKLRDAFYHYWTTLNHNSFLVADKERIRAEFLEPEWASQRSK